MTEIKRDRQTEGQTTDRQIEIEKIKVHLLSQAALVDQMV